MELMLNDILYLTKNEIDNSKIEFNMYTSEKNELFIDRWLAHSKTDKINGTCNNCSFWSSFGKQRNFKPGQWVFSFIKLDENEWLFVSAAVIKKINMKDYAEVEVIDRFKPLFGRLIIKCRKGNTYSRYTFNMNKYLDTAVVKEILPCLYSGEHFEGYDKVHLKFKRLSDILNGKIMPDYRTALEKITGIYCLTDTNTGKLYIGSASGEGGVAQRWGNYLESKHGGNVKLRELYNRKGSEYFEKYFRFTLIEYFGLSYDHDKIIEREQYWKKCFDTIKNGYNDN